MSNEFVEKKSVWKILLIIFIVLSVLFGIGFGGYTLLKTTILNPEKYLILTKKVLNSNINKHFVVFKNENEDKDVKFTGNLSFKVDNKELDYLNKLTIEYTGIGSLDKEEIDSNYKFMEGNKEILDTNFYLIKDSMYLESKDLYSKILLLDKLDVNIFEELKNISNNDIEDTKTIINRYLDFLITALKETKMESEIVSLYKVKYIYEINDSNRDIIQKKYDELIKNDKKIQLLIEKGTIDKDFFNIKFSNFKVEIIKSIFMGKIYNLEITNDEGQVFLLENDIEYENMYHIKDGDDKGTLTIDNDTYTLQWFEDEILVYTFKLTNDEKLFRFSVTSEDSEFVISLKEEKKDEISMTLLINQKDGVSIDLSGTVSKVNEQQDLSFVLDIKENGEKTRIKLDGNIEYGDNLLTNKDVSDVVDINSLSEKEQEEIYNNLYKKLQGTKLLVGQQNI